MAHIYKKVGFKLEICVDNLSSAISAAHSGADRLELSQALDLGGLTPSIGFIRLVMINIRTKPIFMLVRPRAGNFVYNRSDLEIMIGDMNNAHYFGVDGFVTGALTNDGQIDREACGALIKAARGKPVTFHRAFDLTHSEQALTEIVSLGFKRILTSGRCKTASEGMPALKSLVAQTNSTATCASPSLMAASQIIIMPGSGINHLNIQDIFSETNAMEFQSSGQDPKHRTIVENYVVDETTPAPLVSREEIAKMKTALFFLCATQFTKS